MYDELTRQDLQKMQEEMAKADPDMRRIAQIIGQDVGLTLAVLKMVNSPPLWAEQACRVH